MDLFTLCCCPLCQGDYELENDMLVCMSCGKTVSYANGVVDFVDGRLGTALDDIDYDGFYAVSDSAGNRLLHDLRYALGDRWPDNFSAAIEIGAGTGLLTTSMIRHEKSIDLIITDVSPKMLIACRDRINELGLTGKGNLLFATYAGEELVFHSNAFRVCFGSSVLHHILNVPTFLTEAKRFLAPGGVAFFVEPNLTYQAVSIATLADCLASLLANKQLSYEDMDVILLCNWIGEIQQNVLHHGDLVYLATREDKHMFTRASVAAIAAEAGFATSDAKPYSPHLTLRVFIEQIAKQIGVGEITIAKLGSMVDRFGQSRINQLPVADRCQSYVLFFQKGGGEVPEPEKPVVNDTHLADLSRVGPRELSQSRGYIELTFRQEPNIVACTIVGWCFASVPIVWLECGVGDLIEKIAVWRPRPDVHALMNLDCTVPPLHSITSGLKATFAVPALEENFFLWIKLRGADGSTAIVAERAVERTEDPIIISF